MLIRWAEDSDRAAYADFFGEDAPFPDPAAYQALTAADRMRGIPIGMIEFSRAEKRVLRIAALNGPKEAEARVRLRETARRQMSGGSSFHFNYPAYAAGCERESCPFCAGSPMPRGHILLADLPGSLAVAEEKAQGRLFGKCYVILKPHAAHFEEIPAPDMAQFMRDVQTVGASLRRVTGAVRINYELHANSAPHIHCHLFPRYPDDDFPSAPIDYRVTEPSPYESAEEFQWFVAQMQHSLRPTAKGE